MATTYAAGAVLTSEHLGDIGPWPQAAEAEGGAAAHDVLRFAGPLLFPRVDRLRGDVRCLGVQPLEESRIVGGRLDDVGGEAAVEMREVRTRRGVSSGCARASRMPASERSAAPGRGT